jgi:hypothetical protein
MMYSRRGSAAFRWADDDLFKGVIKIAARKVFLFHSAAFVGCRLRANARATERSFSMAREAFPLRWERDAVFPITSLPRAVE